MVWRRKSFWRQSSVSIAFITISFLTLQTTNYNKRSTEKRREWVRKGRERKWSDGQFISCQESNVKRGETRLCEIHRRSLHFTFHIFRCCPLLHPRLGFQPSLIRLTDMFWPSRVRSSHSVCLANLFRSSHMHKKDEKQNIPGEGKKRESQRKDSDTSQGNWSENKKRRMQKERPLLETQFETFIHCSSCFTPFFPFYSGITFTLLSSREMGKEIEVDIHYTKNGSQTRHFMPLLPSLLGYMKNKLFLNTVILSLSTWIVSMIRSYKCTSSTVTRDAEKERERIVIYCHLSFLLSKPFYASFPLFL